MGPSLFHTLSTGSIWLSAWNPFTPLHSTLWPMNKTKHVNQTLEWCLRYFLNFLQDNWVPLLPTAEYSYNNTVHTSTGQIPFFSNYGFHPQFYPPLPNFPLVPLVNLVSHLQQIQQELKAHLNAAKTAYKDQADWHYRHSPTIWLSSKNIKTPRTSAKLDHQVLGLLR